MNYEEIIKKLKANHFNPNPETGLDEKVIGLRIECPAIIRIEDVSKRIEEVLADCGCKITSMKNRGYILIALKKATNKTIPASDSFVTTQNEK
jgi:hypothetical protein